MVQECLRKLTLRYFAPNEVANLMCLEIILNLNVTVLFLERLKAQLHTVTAL